MINTFNGDIHRDDGFIITAPYDEPEYLEYATWVQSGNSPTEFFEEVFVVPESVTRFQIKAAFSQLGLLEQVNDTIALSTTSAVNKLAWQEAAEFMRSSPVINMLVTTLNYTEKQTDDLFILAKQIQA